MSLVNSVLIKYVVQDCWEPMELRERLCKTLYYGRMPALERPSLALTGM